MRIKSLTHINNGIPPKVQGQTIRSKIVLHLGKEEKEHGLKYTAFSRATRFGNVGYMMDMKYQDCQQRLDGILKWQLDCLKRGDLIKWLKKLPIVTEIISEMMLLNK